MSGYRCVLLAVVAAGWPVAAAAQTDPGVGEKEREAAKKHAREVMQAYAGGKHARFADLTHPKIVDLVGGRDKLIDKMKAVDEGMRKTGWAYGEVTVGDPQQFARMETDLVTVVPFSVEYVGPGSRRVDESFLIGVSSDRGKTWTFVDGGRVPRDQLKKVFPKLPDDLKFPTKGKKK